MTLSQDKRDSSIDVKLVIGTKTMKEWTFEEREAVCVAALNWVNSARTSSSLANPDSGTLEQELRGVADAWQDGSEVRRVCLRAADFLARSVAARAEGTRAYYRNALDRAAYALFQLKRFADMPQAAIDFCREQHGIACKVLDDDGYTGARSASPAAKAMPDSPTPRTDAEVFEASPLVSASGDEDATCMVVEAKFARQLERELAAMGAECDYWHTRADDAEDALNDTPESPSAKKRDECELPECQHRLCVCGHAECGHANENVQPNCSECGCNSFKLASPTSAKQEQTLLDAQRVMINLGNYALDFNGRRMNGHLDWIPLDLNDLAVLQTHFARSAIARNEIIEEIAGHTTLRLTASGHHCWLISDVEIRALKSEEK